MGQRRRSRGEWVEVIARWQASGQDRYRFAASLGVSPSTLSWWAWELGRAGKAERASASFVPVEVCEPRASASASVAAAAVVECGGVRLEISTETDPRWVAAVMSELSEC